MWLRLTVGVWPGLASVESPAGAQRSSGLRILRNKGHKLNELTVIEKAAEWQRIAAPVLYSVLRP